MARPGRCIDCGQDGMVHARHRCTPCYWRAHRDSQKSTCRRCRQPGYLRASGHCGPCTRALRPRKRPTPRLCRACGQLRRHSAHGLCSRCAQADPARVVGYAARLADRLPEPPDWLIPFAESLAPTRNPGCSVAVLRELGQLLGAGACDPAEMLQRSARTGRSIGSLAKSLEAFFLATGRAAALDTEERLARGRRDRAVTAVPQPLRPLVAEFSAAQLAARDRARRAGTKPRSHATIMNNLTAVRDLAASLSPQVTGWEQVSQEHLERFLGSQPQYRARRLSSLRAFFRFCRARKKILTDPTRSLRAEHNGRYRGTPVDLQTRRRLYARWTAETTPAPEAFVGLLTMLHGASIAELQHLRINDLDHQRQTIRLGRRPHPVPLDPASWHALQRCLRVREATGTTNPHVLITQVSKTAAGRASSWYLSHLLDPAGAQPQALRTSRLATMTVDLDPVLVAETYGVHPRATLYYLADSVDDVRLDPEQLSTRPTWPRDPARVTRQGSRRRLQASARLSRRRTPR